MKQKIGFIGCGNMGGAIIRGLLESNTVSKEQLYVYDVSAQAREAMEALGVHVATDNESLAQNADVLVLAVKPQFMADTLASTKQALKDKCVISIAAGLKSETIKAMIDAPVRVLRTMPNTPAMVLEGAFGLCSDCDLTEEEKQLAQTLFESLGVVEWVPEKLMDAVCGLSGSGPAFVAEFIEALADAGVREGLPRQTAYRLAAQTVKGTAAMVLEKDIHPGVLKDMVTSPAGTTIEGCFALEKGGFRGATMDAVHAAALRSKELG